MKNILVVGSLNMDMVFNVDHYPEAGETVMSHDFALHSGGKGANQAYAAGKLGGQVHMIGCVGSDAYGRMLTDNLRSVGVDTGAVEVMEGLSSGLAGIAVNKKGENRIIVVPGANACLLPETLDRHDDLIMQSDYVITQLETPVDTVLTLASKAKACGKIMILDPAPARPDLPDELFSLIDILKPNETELQILTGLLTDTCDNVVRAARQLVEKGVGHVVVTLGERGSVIVDSENAIYVPAVNVEAVDTTAAGDAFTAGMVCAMAEGCGMEEAVRFANKVSSIVVTRRGAQTSIPDRSETKDM